MKLAICLGFVGATALAGAASANFYIESEPNNSLATADDVGAYVAPGAAFLVDGSISPSTDQDWFMFTISDAAQIRISIFGRPNSDPPADSFLELFDSAGTLLAFDDDSNINLFSSLEYNSSAGGTFYIRVTSFQGATSFDYKMIVGLNIVPTPGTLALAGMGALALGRRRR
jgi:uncharacterized protein (TIGR03382 family)